MSNYMQETINKGLHLLFVYIYNTQQHKTNLTSKHKQLLCMI